MASIGIFGISAEAATDGADDKQLTAKQRALVPISAFTASGDMDKLRVAVNEGLDAGLTVNEIKEAIVQLYAYTGFPRSLNAMSSFMEVLEKRKAKGIKDTEGTAGKPLSPETDKNEYGTKVQTGLAGGPVKGPIYDFAPALDQFLKEHLFADIFARGVLSDKDREIVTIGALANVEGLEPQLTAHFNIGMNTGITIKQAEEITKIISEKAGKERGDKAAKVLSGIAGRKPAGSDR